MKGYNWDADGTSQRVSLESFTGEMHLEGIIREPQCVSLGEYG